MRDLGTKRGTSDRFRVRPHWVPSETEGPDSRSTRRSVLDSDVMTTPRWVRLAAWKRASIRSNRLTTSSNADAVGLAARRRFLVHDGREEHRVPGHEQGGVARVEEAAAFRRTDGGVGVGEPARAGGPKARRMDGDLLLLLGEEAGDGVREVALQPVRGTLEHRDPADHDAGRGGMSSRFVQIEEIHDGSRGYLYLHVHLSAGTGPGLPAGRPAGRAPHKRKNAAGRAPSARGTRAPRSCRPGSDYP